MMSVVAKLGSLKLTAILILPLIIVVFLVSRADSLGSNWVAIPLGLLGVNLLAAIATNAVFRSQPALLAFHVCLFAMIVLAGIGALYQFDGHIELVEGEAFDAARVELTDLGLLRRNGPDLLNFEQGRIAVDYAPGLIRQSTFSDVLVSGDEGYTSALRFGDRASLTLEGYRFSTSFNKGFTALLQWTGNDGGILLGGINFPSYPEFEWKQVNDWTTPGGEKLSLELVLDARADRTRSWRLQSDDSDFVVIITGPDGRSSQLRRGESLMLTGGRLTVAELRLWMGYRVDSNPILQWVFLAAFLSVATLSLHFQKKYWSIGRRRVGKSEGRQHVYISGN